VLLLGLKWRARGRSDGITNQKAGQMINYNRLTVHYYDYLIVKFIIYYTQAEHGHVQRATGAITQN
jgi:hypothetical protein